MKNENIRKIHFDYTKRSITIDGETLKPKIDVQDRFDWGKDTPAARITAFHILNHYTDTARAFANHIRFTQEIIVNIPSRTCEVEESIIRHWVVRNCQLPVVKIN